MYEYGYTITAGGESRDEILGIIGADQLEAKQIEIDAANRATSMEHRRPTIGGPQAQTTWWVRPVVN